MIDTKGDTDYTIMLCPHNSMLFQAWMHFCCTPSPVPQKHMLFFRLVHRCSLSLFQEFCRLPLGGDIIICIHLSSAMQLQVHRPCCALYTVHAPWVATHPTSSLPFLFLLSIPPFMPPSPPPTTLHFLNQQ